MKFGYRERERFWIAFIVRFAFGLMFLIAALNIFTYYQTKNPPEDPDRTALQFVQTSLQSFSTDLSAPYQGTWVNFKWKWWPVPIDEEAGTRLSTDVGMVGVYWFLYAMPFIFGILSICILTGIALRPAMRLGAAYLVLLGLGKYMAGDSVTTAQDFLYAAFICIGLYMASEDKDVARARLEPAVAD